MPELQVSPALFNKIYLPHVWNLKRFQVFFGSAGSGKSVFLAQRTILHSFLKRTNILIARKYGNTNRNSTYRLIKQIIIDWKLESYFKLNLLHITNKLSGSLILFAGLDDTLKLKSISGIKIIWVEEATLISRLDYLQLNLRLRGRNPQGGITQGFQLWLSFNPVSIMHWLKNLFFDIHNEVRKSCNNKVMDNVFVLKTTYHDNLFIDLLYKNQLEGYKDTSPYHYDVYALGNWGIMGLLVYTNWSVKDFDINKILLTSNYIRVGADWGYNDPTCLLLVSEKDKDIYIILLIYKNKLTTPDISNLIHNSKYIKNYKIIADSALPDRITLLQNLNHPIQGIKKKYIKLGINNIKTRKIYIHPSCINTIKLINGYQYIKDNKTGAYTDTPILNNNHAMDSLRYATQDIFIPVIKPTIQGGFR